MCKGFHLPNAKSVQTCTTVDNEEGQCVQITECETLRQFLDKPMNKEKINFLNQAACGFINNLPKICCPKAIATPIRKETEIEETTPATKTTDVTDEETTIKVSDEFDFNLRNGMDIICL